MDEGDELFDINFTNFTNLDGDDIVFTIKDVPPPKTLTGVFDIYDTDRADKNNDNSGKIGDDENEDRNITTKIVGKEFSLTIGSFSLNDSNKLETHTEDADGDDLYLKYGLLSCKEANSTIDECDEIYVSDQEVLNDKEVDKSFKVDEAVKYGAAFVKVCTYQKSEDEIELYSYDKCDGNTQCQDSDGNEQKCIRKLMSSDKFAIRPEKFVISDIPDEVRAGEEFNVSFVAKDANDNSSSNYNGYLDNNEVELEYSDVKCETGNLLYDTKQFSDGELKQQFSYDEIGELNVTIKEKTPFAIVDKDDKRNKNGVEITPASATIKVLPHHFNIMANLMPHKEYTLVSNDLEMNSTLSLQIEAENKDNKVTKNYKNGCYSKDVTVKVDYDSLYKDRLFNDKDIDLNSFQVKGDKFDNGAYYKNIYLNFHKSYNTPLKPFDLEVKTISANDEDASGQLNMDRNVTFKYARIRYPHSFASYLENVSEKVIYEVYGENGWEIENSHLERDGKIKKFITSRVNASKDNVYNGVQAVTFGYTGPRIYKETIGMDIDSWLWFKRGSNDYNISSCLNHPCVNLLFLKGGKDIWAGKGTNQEENNATTNTIKTNLKNHDTSTIDRSYKKVEW